MPPEVNQSCQANMVSLSTKFSSGCSLLVVLLAVSACCIGEMPLGALYLLIFLGTRLASALGLEKNGNDLPVSTDF